MPTIYGMSLQGNQGVNNGVKLLDTWMLKTRTANKYKGQLTRNLKREDVISCHMLKNQTTSFARYQVKNIFPIPTVFSTYPDEPSLQGNWCSNLTKTDLNLWLYERNGWQMSDTYSSIMSEIASGHPEYRCDSGDAIGISTRAIDRDGNDNQEDYGLFGCYVNNGWITHERVILSQYFGNIYTSPLTRKFYSLRLHNYT